MSNLDPGGHGWQVLHKEPLNIATYKIYKLWASWFKKKNFFKEFPHYCLRKLMTNRDVANLDGGILRVQTDKLE